MTIAEFKNQSVRDLAWAISMPPLIASQCYQCHWPDSEWYQAIYQETLPWIKKLDQDCASLDALLAEQKDKRLGKYFETLWFYWLSHHPRYEVLARNLQIIIDGETLGEIDFILFDKKNKQVLHWELAVKFYLGIGDTSQMNNWYGPNLRDRLDLKVNHLINRQSMISKDRRVAEWLQKQGIVIDQCMVILKGRLYYPYYQLQDQKVENINKIIAGGEKNLISPAQSTIDHLRSVWLRLSDIDDVFGKQQGFLPLLNRGWLESLSTDCVKKILSKEKLFETLSNKKLRLPLNLRLYPLDSTSGSIFLVDENWAKNL